MFDVLSRRRDGSCLFFQAEGGIRGGQEARGLGNVDKRQLIGHGKTS